MALKNKIDKATYEALNDVIKAEYKEKDGYYYLDTDEASGLANALEAQKKDNLELKARLDALDAAAKEAKAKEDEANAETNRKKKDYDALEADYKKKLADAEANSKQDKEKLQNSIRKMLVDNKALELATELGGDNAEILLPHIRNRLQADFDGETPVTRVLDKSGALSASTVDDLRKEFVDNPKFSPILVGTRASGGNANGGSAPTGKLGGKEPKDMNDAERAEMFKTNPDAFYAAFPHLKEDAA